MGEIMKEMVKLCKIFAITHFTAIAAKGDRTS
jgi:hypothetical protein